MTACARFRYPLEPLLSIRQWALDDLLTDLRRTTASIAALRGEIAGFDDRADEAANEWKRRAGAADALQTGEFQTMTDYLRDLVCQRAARRRELAALEEEAQRLSEKAALARKLVDVVERHRERLRTDFVRARAGAEYKDADDKWSVLRAAKQADEN